MCSSVSHGQELGLRVTHTVTRNLAGSISDGAQSMMDMIWSVDANITNGSTVLFRQFLGQWFLVGVECCRIVGASVPVTI